MNREYGDQRLDGSARFLSWLPLLAAGLASYGPVANNYGFALYFLSWNHGFVKRGLVGTIFAHAGFLSHQKLLAIEYTFLAVAFALTYVVFRPMLFGDRNSRLLAAVLLAAPAVMPHIGFLFAQPDVTLYTLVLLCLWAWMRLPARNALWLSTLLSLIALLAHEAFLLMFFPLFFMIAWRACRRGQIAAWEVAASTVVFVCAWLAIIHWGTLAVPPEVVWREATARTDVPVGRQVYDVMSFTLAEQFALVRRMYTLGVIRILIVTLVLCAPYFWLLGRMAAAVLRGDGAGRTEKFIFAAAMLAPLLLCAFGHDTTRWIGAACIDVSFYCMFVFMTADDNVRRSFRERLQPNVMYVWLAYLLLVGPMGATGLRAAEQIDVLFQ